MAEITRRQALKAAPAVAVAVVPALALGLAPQATAGPSFGERVLALSPERQQMMMEALAAAEAPVASGGSEIARLFSEWVEVIREGRALSESEQYEACDRKLDRETEIIAAIAGLEPESAADLAMQMCVWWGVYPDACDDDAGLAGDMGEPMRKRVLALAGMHYSPDIAPGYEGNNHGAWARRAS